MSYIKHIAGEYDEETKMQICVLCGAIIIDMSNAFYCDGDPMSGGFAPGDVYKTIDGSGTTKHIDNCDEFKTCIPNR